MRLLGPCLCVLGLTACSPEDGSWVFYYTMTENTLFPDSQDIGVEQRAMASLYRTSDHVVVVWNGRTLVGTRDGDHFDASTEVTEDFSSDTCTVAENTNTATLSANFSGDVGLEGEFKVVDATSVSDCDWWPDTDEANTTAWSVEGLQLAVHDDAHASSGAHSGYLP